MIQVTEEYWRKVDALEEGEEKRILEKGQNDFYVSVEKKMTDAAV